MHTSRLAALTFALAAVLAFSGAVAATPPGQSPPVNTSLPTISGTAQVGQTLTASPGTWSGPNLHLAGQWLRCDSSGLNCLAIGGATSKTYVPQTADVGYTMRVVVTASNKNGSTSATSNPTVPVQAVTSSVVAPAVSSVPTISGTPQQGQTLNASPGTWNGTLPLGYGYQWKRCDSGGTSCSAVSGATSQSYTLSSTDVNSAMQVAVTASNTAGSATASSSDTAPVSSAAATISPTTVPGAKVGVAYSQQLSASGPTPPYSFKLSQGSLPSGISLSSAGLLSGTPSVSGSFAFTVALTDGTGSAAASQAYTLSVASASSSGSTKLTWAPPALNNPITITEPDSGGNIYMDSTKDYIVKVGHLNACGGLWLEGGHNVVVIGGEITIPGLCGSAYDRTAVKVRSNTGTVHLEGLEIDGPYTHDGIVTAAPQATLQIENVRIESVQTYDANHSDCIQTQAGLGALRVDHFTCRTQLQGFFLKDETSTVCHLGLCDLRNSNISGLPGMGKYLFWQETTDIPVSLSNVWLQGNDPTWTDFGMWVWPNKNAEGQSDPNRRAVVSSDGSYLWFTNSNISGTINKGTPPGGDFVPTGVAGTGYVSPGYATSSATSTGSRFVSS
jgi:hypothetical protein